MDCLFCKMVEGVIPTQVVFESDEILGFRDIHPQAPTHVLFIPKRHISTINDIEPTDTELLGNLILAAKHVAKAEGLSETGYRLNFNVNRDGGQTVYHIHLHMLGGRSMTWPPG